MAAQSGSSNLTSRIRSRFFSRRPKLTPLESWYLNALNYQLRRSKLKTSPFGNYYEFGVGWGSTMSKYLRALAVFCRGKSLRMEDFRIFGFDSFEGLPSPRDARDSLISWPKGAFAVSEDTILERVRKEAGGKALVRLVRGFFDESLTNGLRTELSRYPPSIVTVDVDYYSSAKTVLEWLRPILVSGVIFYFDDIWSFHGNPLYGELAAIQEFNDRNEGFLTPFPILGMTGYAYVYSKKDFEYVTKSEGESPIGATSVKP